MMMMSTRTPDETQAEAQGLPLLRAHNDDDDDFPPPKRPTKNYPKNAPKNL